MGFDLTGINPTSESGEYFRNNVWWWHPLWDFITYTCDDILTEKQIEYGHYNDCIEISASDCRQLSTRLHDLLNSGDVKQYEENYKLRMDSIPDKKCSHCNGTGTRNDQYVRGTCNACAGKGMVRPFSTHYPFTESNVKEFLAFVETSGGFLIC